MHYPSLTHIQPSLSSICAWVGIFLFLFAAPSGATDGTLQLQLSPHSFSRSMCKKIHPLEDIRIKIAHHRDLVLRTIKGQFIPMDWEEARKRSYVRAVTLADITNGVVVQGAIAFTEDHAIIFTADHPEGLSRERFLKQLQVDQQELANQALSTFLRLHKVFNAALNACRPYPSKVTYGTDDEIEKIQTAQKQYAILAKTYNVGRPSGMPFVQHESGKSGGFVDPSLNSRNVSYHAMNPLVFYQP